MEGTFFLEMKEECKVFFVKLFLGLIVAQKGTNIQIFSIFESGAQYSAECSAESGAKQYFIEMNVYKFFLDMVECIFMDDKCMIT